ncbi:MAG: ribulose-phosphate 3-epimerase [Bacteroidales bacterium]|jgi:ribulose-phosphate 3-epimerase|nr:ribulose-phosphate 3-epimerase [Bacteroidales bacterium]
MGILLAPSLLSGDFGDIRGTVKILNEGDADMLHLDIMDGVFVPNISFGFPVVDAIAKYSEKPLDAHLMITDPDPYIDRFCASGVSMLSVHYEVCTHLNRTVNHIKDKGMKAGVAINPHTPVSLLEDIIGDLDFVLLMSVNPGFSGQGFIQNTYSKLRRLKKLAEVINPDCLIEVDGGINVENAAAVKAAGADIIVAGSSVLGTKNPMAAMKELKTVCSG